MELVLLFCTTRQRSFSRFQEADECEARWKMWRQSALMENTQKTTVTHTCWSFWRFQCVGCGFGCFEGRASDQRRPLLPQARETNHSFHFPFQLLSVSMFLWMMAHLSRCYWTWLFRVSSEKVKLDQLRWVSPTDRPFFCLFVEKVGPWWSWKAPQVSLFL